MSKSEMVLVPRALLGAVASALDTGSPAQKTLASVRELYLSDDFPDTKDMQEAGKYTSGADWAQEANSIDLGAADFSDALVWLKEGKRVFRSGWNGSGQFAWMVPPGSYPARMEAIKGHYPDDMVPYGAYLALKNAQETVVPWVPSVGDLLATDWEVLRDNVITAPSYRRDNPDGTQTLVIVENALPHQCRVIEEYSQLRKRHKDLTKFFDTELYAAQSAEERNRLKEQSLLMGEYLRVLLSRIQAFC